MTAFDPELVAMSAVVDAIKDLDDDVRARVIDWAAKRYDVKVQATKPEGGDDAAGAAEDEESAAHGFKHFSDVLDATHSPRTDADRALVGGYWFQVVQGQETFTGYQVNNELKNAGHGIGNITDALTTLQRRTPAQVRQTMKSGRTKQARKTYKLTVAGVRAVEAMMGEPTGGQTDEA